MNSRICCFLLFFFLFQSGLFAQADSSQNPTSQGKPLKEVKDTARNKARTACLLSAALPGAGQIYNKKGAWYKVPILYGGGALLIYSINVYQSEYERFRKALIKRRANEPINDEELEPLPEDVLLNVREYYREQRDLSYVYLLGLYVLNIMEAGVTAHLKDFDVSETLSLRVEPRFHMVQGQTFSGISLALRFK